MAEHVSSLIMIVTDLEQNIKNDYIFAICQCDLKSTEYFTTKCKHSFHLNCINKSVNTKKECPMCRDTNIEIKLDFLVVPVEEQQNIIHTPSFCNEFFVQLFGISLRLVNIPKK